MIDLHFHSTFSDGSDTPEQLVARGVAAGLHALALTDHDSTHGVAAFLTACRQQHLAGLSGVEISAEVASGTLHILGLGVDPAHAELSENLDRVLDGRDWRNHQILKKLNDSGLTLTWEEVASLAGEDVVGRPHFAQAMIRRGYATGTQDVFDRYLAKGQPAYVDRFRLSPEEGIRLIRAAGGVAVVAHPFTWEPDFAALEARLAALRDAGLGGIEAYYSEHTPEQTVAYLRFAKRLGLLVTGGSDYHGGSKDGIALGSGFGNLSVPDDLLPPLLAALTTQAGVV
jgi:predicted metal-dependent phosphoesterase TrpH